MERRKGMINGDQREKKDNDVRRMRERGKEAMKIRKGRNDGTGI